MLLRCFSSVRRAFLQPLASNVNLRQFGARGAREATLGISHKLENEVMKAQMYHMVKDYAPLTSQQLYEIVKRGDRYPHMAVRSFSFLKILLDSLLKREIVLKMNNVLVGGHSQGLLHIGKGIEPEDPALCPNTEAIKRYNQKDHSKPADGRPSKPTSGSIMTAQRPILTEVQDTRQFPTESKERSGASAWSCDTSTGNEEHSSAETKGISESSTETKQSSESSAGRSETFESLSESNESSKTPTEEIDNFATQTQDNSSSGFSAEDKESTCTLVSSSIGLKESEEISAEAMRSAATASQESTETSTEAMESATTEAKESKETSAEAMESATTKAKESTGNSTEGIEN